MRYFYVFNFNHRRRKFFFILLAIGLLILLASELGRYYFIAPKIESVTLMKGNTKEKNIALTFNISWGEEKVYDILNALEKHDIRAAFFVSGEWAERHPQIVEEITKQQHELGMLGYRYKNYLEQEIVQVRKDMLYAKEVFRKLGYKNVQYIRPPSGHFNKDVMDVAERLDLHVIHWSIDPGDWENPGAKKIIDNVKKASNGDIILLHASDAAKQTAEALHTLIPYFKDKKYSFVTISELYHEVKVQEKLVD